MIGCSINRILKIPCDTDDSGWANSGEHRAFRLRSSNRSRHNRYPNRPALQPNLHQPKPSLRPQNHRATGNFCLRRSKCVRSNSSRCRINTLALGGHQNSRPAYGKSSNFNNSSVSLALPYHQKHPTSKQREFESRKINFILTKPIPVKLTDHRINKLNLSDWSTKLRMRIIKSLTCRRRLNLD